MSPRPFGQLPGGESVQAWTLGNAVGASLQVIDYGGIVTHLWIPRPAARAFEPASGRVLEVRTTDDYLQFYSGLALDDSLRGKSGSAYGPHHGFCMECEGYPNGATLPALGDIVVRPGRPRRHTTTYAFSVD